MSSSLAEPSTSSPTFGGGWPGPAVSVLVAADESIRRADDPYRVARLGAADIAVLKVQPLGGVRASLEIADRIGLPVVVSSALETSIGIRAGLALAAALPELPYACGLNTVATAERRCSRPVLGGGGRDDHGDDLVVDADLVDRVRAADERAAVWQARLVSTRERMERG